MLGGEAPADSEGEEEGPGGAEPEAAGGAGAELLPPPPSPPPTPLGGDEDAEMERLRALLPSAPAPGPQAPTQGGAAAPRRVRALRVVRVEKDPLGRFVERSLYVFGEDNIARYREQQRNAEQAAANIAEWCSANADQWDERLHQAKTCAGFGTFH